MSVSRSKGVKTCPCCGAKLDSEGTETGVNEGFITMVKCGACEGASTWINGNLRSYTTNDGRQVMKNPTFKIG